MNNTPLGEIRKALKEAHEHDLDADPMPWPGNANLQYWVGDHYDGIGAFVSYNDAYLAANAPTWLRSLIDEKERLNQKAADDEATFNRIVEAFENQHRENLEELQRLREELEQVKKERDELRVVLKGCEYWHKRAVDELAAKDKELEWYGGGSEDGGEKARSILEQYARSAIVPTE